MDKNQILQDLNENIKNIDNLDNELAMINLAIYQKSVDSIKKEKIQNLKNYFENETSKYGVNADKFKDEIKLNLDKYEEQINKLVNVYDDMYLNVFKMMQTAVNNQKIAIANIITELDKRNSDNVAKETNNVIIACIQKKLNYSVIDDECYARLKWCTDEIEKDLNEIFTNDFTQLQIYEKNLFIRLRIMFFNKLFGKNKYKKFLLNYENECLSKIKEKNNLKIMEVVAISEGVSKQIENVTKQIIQQYNEMCA